MDASEVAASSQQWLNIGRTFFSFSNQVRGNGEMPCFLLLQKLLAAMVEGVGEVALSSSQRKIISRSPPQINRIDPLPLNSYAARFSSLTRGLRKMTQVIIIESSREVDSKRKLVKGMVTKANVLGVGSKGMLSLAFRRCVACMKPPGVCAGSIKCH